MKPQYTNEEKVAYFNQLLVEACERNRKATTDFERVFWITRIRNLARILERLMYKNLK